MKIRRLRRDPRRGAVSIGLVSWIALCLLCAAACRADAQTPDTAPAQQVHGVVIDAVTRKPIFRALVTSQDGRLATMTDTQGSFTFEIRQPAQAGSAAARNNPMRSFVSLIARRPGYTNQTSTFQIALDAATPTAPDVTIKLIPQCLIYGHVSASSGDLPANLSVQLRRRQVQDGIPMWNQMSNAQVNDRGDFRFAELQPGDYKVMVAASTQRVLSITGAEDQSPGFLPAFAGGASDLAGEQPIHLTAGQSAQADMSLQAATFYHVRIPVPNLTQGGLSVSVGDEDRSSGFTMAANVQAHAVEGFLPRGSYEVHITSFQNNGDRTQTYLFGRGRAEVAAAPLAGEPISLMPTLSVPVIVRQEHTAAAAATPQQDAINRGNMQRAPLSLMNITLRPTGSMTNAAMLRTRSKPDDPLLVDNVREGAYHVIASANAGYVESMSSGGVDLLRHPLVIAPGVAPAPIYITIADGFANLAVTVDSGGLSEAGSAAVLTIIFCIPMDEPYRQATPSFSFNGKASIQNLAPGRYLVLATRNLMQDSVQFEGYANEDLVREMQGKGTVVTVAAGESATVQVPLLPEEEAL